MDRYLRYVHRQSVLGSFISSIYRGNVDDQLAGEVPEPVLEAAKEGIGVVAATVPQLPADVGATAFQGASTAFVDAMNSGFWLSAAVLAAGAVVAAWLLPDEVRAHQAVRDTDVELDLSDEDLERLRSELV